MGVTADQVVAGLTLLGGGAVGASLAGILGGLLKGVGARLHLFIIGGMAIGAGMGFTYGGPTSIPGYVGAAEAQAMDLGLPSGGREEAVLKVLRAYYPSDYARAVAVLAPRKGEHAPPVRTQAAFDRAVTPVLARETPQANTENTLDMIRLARREQKAMMSDPALCYRTMRARGRQASAFHGAAALRDEEMRLTARLLTQTALAPEVSRLPADVDERLRRLAGAALADLQPAERAAFLSVRGHASPTRAQASAACDLGVKLYDAMLMAPDSEAAQMYKGLASAGFQRVAYR